MWPESITALLNNLDPSPLLDNMTHFMTHNKPISWKGHYGLSFSDLIPIYLPYTVLYLPYENSDLIQNVLKRQLGLAEVEVDEHQSTQPPKRVRLPPIITHLRSA